MNKSAMVLLASTALVASCSTMPAVFANANAGSKVYVCATAQQNDLDRAGFESLTWVEIKSLGSHGEVGSTTNIISYDEWATDVTQKAKGITDAGSPEVEFARLPNDPGQIILRAAAKTNLNYAVKMVRNDPAVLNGSPTTIYNRGLVTGPKRPMGRNEDFDLEVYMLAFNQREVIVDPGAGGLAPTNTVIPAITGTAQVGQVLTLSNGTFTGDAVIVYAYNWFAGGVMIIGANSGTFTLTSAQLGKIITGRVNASNASGSATAQSAATSVVIA